MERERVTLFPFGYLNYFELLNYGKVFEIKINMTYDVHRLNTKF